MADITGRMSSPSGRFRKIEHGQRKRSTKTSASTSTSSVDKKLKQLNQNLEDEKNRLRDMGATDDLQRFEQERTLMLELAKAQGEERGAATGARQPEGYRRQKKIKIQDFKDSGAVQRCEQQTRGNPKEIDDENAILQRNTDLKTKTDEFQAKDDLQNSKRSAKPP